MEYPPTPPPLLGDDIQPMISGPNRITSTMIRDALIGAGWTPEAINWAVSNVPVNLLSGEVVTRGFQGGYYAGNPGRIEVMRDALPPIPYARDRDNYNRGLEDNNATIVHEMRHAYENNNNIKVPPGDYYQALREMGPIPALKDWFNREGRGGIFAVPIQDDPVHFNATLLDKRYMGYNPQDLPEWYRKSYLPEYR